ncbi:MAG: hypothetical protein VKK80_07420 [Prochlorothrix sp.]|nr:hypothetical protein [Prochlorothrix sp.]
MPPSRRSVSVRARRPGSSPSRGQWILGGVTGMSVLIFLLSNFSPSISLSILGIVSQPLPLVVWLTLAGVAGSMTALVLQGLYQGLAPSIQVTRPRMGSSAGGRRDRGGAGLPPLTEPWDEEALTDWVEGRSPAPNSPDREAVEDRMGEGSPWQRVAAASMDPRSAASKDPRPQTDDRRADRSRQSATGASTPPGAEAVGGGWDDRPNPNNDWEDLWGQVQAAQGTAEDSDDRGPRGDAAQTGARGPGPEAQNPRDRPGADRLTEVQRPPAEERRSGSVYSYRYRPAAAPDRPPAATRSPSPPVPDPRSAPRQPQRPPAYLNNPQAGQPDAIYDVNYRIITPSQPPASPADAAPQSPQRPPRRSRQQATPAPPASSEGTPPSRTPPDDWDQGRAEDW